jgi:hypothetical protein
METVLSYYSARMFLTGLLLMAAIRPCQSGGAVNDNNGQSQVGLSIKPSRHKESTRSLQSEATAAGRVGHVIAALALVAGVLAVPLLQGLVAPATTTGEQRPEVIRGSPIAPALLHPQRNQ